ncbi:hypothetical protein [Thermopirellula anaerolimosa]
MTTPYEKTAVFVGMLLAGAGAAATTIRFRFTTEADPTWDDAKSLAFEVVPNDEAPREYVVDMSSVPGWKGTLKQLRLDLATGQSLTGTCRFDYIAIVGEVSRQP